MAFRPSQQQKKRKMINEVQSGFSKGYISELADSRMPSDGLADMTNAWLTQDALPTPRPSLVRYGVQPLGELLGVGSFNRIVGGAPERWEITMQSIAGKGNICIRRDGGSWANVGGDYDPEALVTFSQAGSRVYIGNGVDSMSYYDIGTSSLTYYTEIPKPTGLTATKTGLSGSNYTHYYKVTAFNKTGETEASIDVTITADKLRNEWVADEDSVKLSWDEVTGAEGYNVYSGTSATEIQLVSSGVHGATFTDDGTSASNPFKVAPSGNSTKGPVLRWLYNSDSQVWGCGDPENPSYVWYTGSDQNSGNFSVHFGGGYVAIDDGGSTVPVSIRSFRDGKGDPVITVLSQGAAGSGKLSHIRFNERTYGNTVIIYPEVYEANGMSGTTSPMAVIEANNSLYYPTGQDFKTTGTKPNVMNILTTDSISQSIDADVKGLNLSAMHKSVGLEYQNKLFWSVPYASEDNSEIWLLDLSRRGIWILRWTIAAKFMWLYEDNSGRTHHIVYADGKIMEFTESVKTEDDGVPFRTRVATGSMTFDDGGVGMAAVQFQRFKLLYPRGRVKINGHGLGENRKKTRKLIEHTFNLDVSNSGYGQFMYDSSDPIYFYDGDVGELETSTSSMEVVPLRIDKTLNELMNEIITEEAGVDYILSTIHTEGIAIPRYYYGD